MTQNAPTVNALSPKPHSQALALVSNKINSFSLATSSSAPAFPNFPKNKIVVSLYQRIATPQKIDQNPASLCGPAAFFYILARFFPDVYVQAAIDLYQRGETKIGSLSIKPSTTAKSMTQAKLVGSYTTMDEVDWLLLASLRDSENDIFNYDSVKDEFPGITMPGQLAEWYRKIGARDVINDTNVVFSKSINKILKTQQNKDNGYSVCLFVNMNILVRSAISKPVVAPNHWIVLTSDIFVDGQKINFNTAAKLTQERLDYYDENSNVQSFKHNIAFDVYSWGQSPSVIGGGISKASPVDLENFLDHYYGFVAVKF